MTDKMKDFETLRLPVFIETSSLEKSESEFHMYMISFSA